MGLDQHQRVLRATGLHSEGGSSFAHGPQGPGPQSAWWQQRLAHCGRCETLEHSLRGERERGWAGGILKTAAGRRVSEPRGAGSHAEVILSQPAWRSGEHRVGEEKLLPLSHLRPCHSQLWGEPGTPGAFPEEAPCLLHSTVACAPQGQSCSCCSASSSGFYK